MRFQAQRGTQDVLPAQSQNWQWLEAEFRDLARLYGYREIRTPGFEDTDLFVRTSGETSEIVSKQMYSFKDKGDRDITLKPEGTAPTIRAAIEHNLCPPGNVVRLWYNTPFYRYERPQKGRLREAHQFGLELIGSPSPAADAEIIEITVRFYERLGLKGINVLLNSIGRDACRAAFRDTVLAHADSYLKSQGDEAIAKARKNPLRLLDSKDPGMQEALKNLPPILDFLEPECKSDFEEVQRLLRLANVQFTVSPGIVRGLDYYTGTVFEVQSSKLGAQTSLCGGGRYDNLFKELGGPPIPSVGVGIGIERALIVLEEEGLLRQPQATEVFVAYTGEDVYDDAVRLAAELRSSGISVLMDVDRKTLKSQFKQADKAEVPQMVVVGADELAEGKVTLRDLKTGEQRLLSQPELVKSMRSRPGNAGIPPAPESDESHG